MKRRRFTYLPTYLPTYVPTYLPPSAEQQLPSVNRQRKPLLTGDPEQNRRKGKKYNSWKPSWPLMCTRRFPCILPMHMQIASTVVHCPQNVESAELRSCTQTHGFALKHPPFMGRMRCINPCISRAQFPPFLTSCPPNQQGRPCIQRRYSDWG